MPTAPADPAPELQQYARPELLVTRACGWRSTSCHTWFVLHHLLGL